MGETTEQEQVAQMCRDAGLTQNEDDPKVWAKKGRGQVVLAFAKGVLCSWNASILVDAQNVRPVWLARGTRLDQLQDFLTGVMVERRFALPEVERAISGEIANLVERTAALGQIPAENDSYGKFTHNILARLEDGGEHHG